MMGHNLTLEVGTFLACFTFLILNFRASEMTVTNERMKIQLIEKEKTIQALQRNVSALESRQAADQTENETAKALREETEELHAALR